MTVRNTMSREVFRPLIAAILSLAAGIAAAEVTVHENIAYKSGDALSAYERERCVLDLYLPEGVSDFPILVWFHGGSITAGDKAAGGQADIVRSLAERGIAVASVNYRLSPRVGFPTYIEDAAASVAWALDNIAGYGGDADNVYVSGHSAGGYLAAMVGVDEQYLAAHGYALSDIAGMLPISGQMITHETIRAERGLPTNRPLIDEAAPVFHVSTSAPPWLAIAGSEDLPARPEENRYFVAALKAVGHEAATYREFAGRNHGSIVSMMPQRDDPVAAALLDFIAAHQR